MTEDNKVIRHKNLSGSNNPNWKGGIKRDEWYYRILKPEHPNADNQGYVAHHRLIYEHYLSIIFDEDMFIPKEYEIHHITPVKEGGTNALINLTLMTRGEHQRHHTLGNRNNRGKHKDLSDRKCFRCGTNKTPIQNPSKFNKMVTPCPRWHHIPEDKINWYCQKCFDRLRRLRKKGCI